MRGIYTLLAGVVLGLLLPVIIDWMMFGTVAPCREVGKYQDKIIMECMR
jgi:hypothetical protein